MSKFHLQDQRLYVQWGPHLTTSFPVLAGVDGRYVVCTDTEEAEALRDHLAPGAALHPFNDTWDPRALALTEVLEAAHD
mgnify:CR=1 FL=1